MLFVLISCYVTLSVIFYHTTATTYHDDDDTQDIHEKMVSHMMEIPTLPSQLVEYVYEDNVQRFKKVEKKVKEIMNRFEVEKFKSISALTHGISSGILDLANVRRDLRENLVYAQIMPQFKPAGIKEGDQRELWNAIDDGVIQIYNAAFSVMNADAEFQGNFHRIYDSIQTAINAIENGLEFDLATNIVKKDLKKWQIMQIKFEKTIDELSDDTFKTLANIIRNAKGPNEIQQQIQNAPKYYHEYTEQFDIYQNLEDERFKEVQPIRIKLAENTARYEHALFEYNNYENSAQNVASRDMKIKDALDALNDKYSTTDQNIKVTKYRTETYATGWWGLSTGTRTVPYTESIANPERIRIKERIDIWKENKKENDQNLKTSEEQRSEWKKEAEKAKEDINVLEQKLNDIENKWSEKLQKQEKNVKLAEKKWNETNEKLKQAFEETGVNDQNIVEFLKLAHQFPEHAMKTHQANKGMDEFIKSFYSLLEHRIGTNDRDETIKQHFEDLGAKNYDRIYTAMKEQGMNIMADLEIDSMEEHDEIVKVINEQLANSNEKVMNFGEKRFLSRIIKGNFKNKQVRSKSFIQEFALIMDFFHDIYDGVKEIKDQLPMISTAATNKYYTIGMDYKQEL